MKSDGAIPGRLSFGCDTSSRFPFLKLMTRRER